MKNESRAPGEVMDTTGETAAAEKAADKKVTEKKAAEKKTAGKKAAGKKTAGKKTAGKKAVLPLEEKYAGAMQPAVKAVTEKPVPKKAAGPDYSRPDYYVCRELSWLEFNERVLNEARDRENPLFERLKFLSITSSNLDEFFMVRVASLKDQVHAHYKGVDIAGLTPEKQLRAISDRAHRFVEQQYVTLNRSLLPSLDKEGVHLIQQHEDLTEQEAAYVDRYFHDTIYPVLTPMAVDSSRPFPLVRNRSLNIGALIRKKKGVKPLIRVEEKKVKHENGTEEIRPDFAIVQVPTGLPRVVEIPETAAEKREGIRKTLILMEEIIERNIGSLFLNYDIVAAHPFRIMRNAEFELDEEEAADLLAEIQKKLKSRQWGEAIRLEVEDTTDRHLLKILRSELNIGDDDLFRINGPLDLTVLMKLYSMPGFERLKYPPHVPQPVPELMNEDDIFTNIRKRDILLSHPYESFDPVVQFIQTAARDPEVLAIKQTLYRVSGNSPIIAALAEAADNGKQVSVLVELKARFDEENNILWAQMLEKAGCHVIYGLVGLKTHSKITLVVRNEEDGIRRYVHLATGNYNDSTAKLYTDVGIFTCRREFGEDATAVFNMLSGYSEPVSWNRLIVAPLWMKDRFLNCIEKVKQAVLAGKPAFIHAKMNSLSDQDMISALYAASAAGVKIELVVRGICCLKTGIKGVSENIRVHSIVGNFLEHARIFIFHADSEEDIYLGSADWMTRNLENRVEIVFPVVDEDIRARIRHYMDTELADNVKASILLPDGSYEKEDLRGKMQVNSQEQFAREAEEAARKVENERKSTQEKRTFTPAGRL